VPPEPPPLPRGDLVSRLAWAGVLLGPAFLLLSAIFWDGAGPLALAVAALAFVAGFVTLVSRLPAHRDDDDDDGAVV
jgi:fatty acid desaturase